MKVLEFLRSRLWYRTVVTSRLFRPFLRVLPRRTAFRILKRLGPVSVRIKLGAQSFWIVTSSEDDHYMDAMLNGLRGWEAESLRSWVELCSKGGTVVDVGAYGGVYTAIAIASGADRVIAYEPNPVMFTRLESTVAINHQSGRVTARNVALSSFAGSSTLFVLDGRSGTSGARLEDAPRDSEYTWAAGPVVSVTTLQDELEMLGVSSVSALKIDVEGLESEVLEGARDLLRKQSPTLIVECLTESALDKVTAILAQFGYGSASPLDHPRSSPEGALAIFGAGNFLFRPEVSDSQSTGFGKKREYSPYGNE